MDDSFFDVLQALRRTDHYFELASHAADHLMISVAVPGERWEIEYHQEGRWTIERFQSTGVEQRTPAELARLFEVR